jgi:hypothetical protein
LVKEKEDIFENLINSVERRREKKNEDRGNEHVKNIS